MLSYDMCDENNSGSICDYFVINVDIFRKSVCMHCVSDDISDIIHKCIGRTAASESKIE